MPKPPKKPNKPRGEPGFGTIYKRQRTRALKDGTTKKVNLFVVEFRRGDKPKLVKAFSSEAKAKAWRLSHVGPKPEAQAAVQKESAKVTLCEQVDMFLIAAADKDDGVEPTTRRGYRDTLKLHVVPRLGAIPLHSITTDDIRTALEGVKQDVSESMRQRCQRVLHKLFAWSRITPNPVASLNSEGFRPRKSGNGVKSKDKAPSIAACKAIFKAAKGHRYEALLTTAVCCGLRWGELAGLRWGDVDFKKKTISVNQTLREVSYEGNDGKEHWTLERKEGTKTKGPGDLIDLPEFVLAALTSRLKAAKAEGYGPGHGRGEFKDLVFLTPSGTPLRKRNFRRDFWDDIREKAKVPNVTMHGLRAAMSSILASKNASAKMIATRMRHSDVRLTMNTYTNLDRTSQAEAATIFDDVFAE